MDKKLEQAAWDDLVWGDVMPEETPVVEPVLVPEPAEALVAAKVSPIVPAVVTAAPPRPEPAVLPTVDDDEFEPPPPPVSINEVPKRSAQLPAAQLAPVHAAALVGTKPLPMHTGTVALMTLTLADGSTKEVTVSGEVFTVGRRSENDLAIKDRHVSGEHARLVLRPDGDGRCIS